MIVAPRATFCTRIRASSRLPTASSSQQCEGRSFSVQFSLSPKCSLSLLFLSHFLISFLALSPPFRLPNTSPPLSFCLSRSLELSVSLPPTFLSLSLSLSLSPLSLSLSLSLSLFLSLCLSLSLSHEYLPLRPSLFEFTSHQPLSLWFTPDVTRGKHTEVLTFTFRSNLKFTGRTSTSLPQ